MERRRIGPRNGLARAAWLFLALAAVTARDASASRSPSDSVRIAPGPDGALGAWLVIGPFHTPTSATKSKTPEMMSADIDANPIEIDEHKLAPNLGDAWEGDTRAGNAPDPKSPGNSAPAWVLASSGEGPIDVKAALKTKEADVVGYAAGTLEIARGGKFVILLGTDDGVRLTVDGKTIFTRDEARPYRSDDDVIPVDLAAGDHPVVLKLHQRDGAWSFRFRIVDASLAPPAGASLELAGTHASDAAALAKKMSWVSLDRGMRDDRYAPTLTVRFPEGSPLGVKLGVHAKLVAGIETIFDEEVGDVPHAKNELAVPLPEISADALGAVERGAARYTLDVAGRVTTPSFLALRPVREACAHAGRALAAVSADEPWLPVSTRDSVEYLAERLVRLVAHGDTDASALVSEAKELEELASAIDRHVDPYASRTGFLRRAYRSPVDSNLAEYGVYVPPSYKPSDHRKLPLIVALHGMNGEPMGILRWIFGGDEKGKDQSWEARHYLDPVPRVDAIIAAPNGHGNTMYRQLGQDDISRVVDEVEKQYPIDLSRVTITGPSMGGIGTAALAFRHPDVFAAAEPLCGYHSYFVRRDIAGKPLRPWERFLAEERSNVFWAENGAKTPLFIVHGTFDTPTANSGVLIDKYESLGFSVVHEHPHLGHNVWQTTYENMRGINWLLAQRPRDLHPSEIHFKTARLRDGDDAWLHVDAFTAPATWGEVSARASSTSALDVTTSGVSELHFDRDPRVLDGRKPTTVRIDKKDLTFMPDAPLAMHLERDGWHAGPALHANVVKQGRIAGPIRDAFSEPLLFVYGASDPAQTRANQEVAESWAKIRWGVDVRYPILSDVEFFDRGESLANDRSLFLVGNAASNRVLAALERDLPITLKNGQIVTSNGQKFSGSEAGAAFIRPNPRQPDRYVVVVEGVSALGTWRSLSLPDLLPDFVVYDERVAPSRGQIVLGPGSVLAAGFFDDDWGWPAKTDDPLARMKRPAAKSESDATPYLP